MPIPLKHPLRRFTSVPLFICVILLPVEAIAKSKPYGTLPEPYVSPTLDAVMMPITREVVAQFALPKSASGAVIVSVEPGGIADIYGFEPGEVLSAVEGKWVRHPVDIDSIMVYWHQNGSNYFHFEGSRHGRYKTSIVYLESDDFETPPSYQKVASWRGYETQRFRYIDWYSPHSYYIESIFLDTLDFLAAVVIADAFISAISSDDAYFYFEHETVETVIIREDWIYSETRIYCGDVSGYGCGLSEVGYPTIQEIAECSGAPGDDWCMAASPEEDYCSVNPGDEICSYGETPQAMTAVSEDIVCVEFDAEGNCLDETYIDPTGAAEASDEVDVTDFTEQEVDPFADYEVDPRVEGYNDLEEPVYEEPAYEEQAYEEPVPGIDNPECYDEYGNFLC